MTLPESRDPDQLYPDEEPTGIVAHTLMDRFELLLTLVLDSLFVAAAIVSRGLLLRLFQLMVPAGDSGSIYLKALHFVINIVLVAAAVIITVFDLTKRVRNAWADLRSPDR